MEKINSDIDVISKYVTPGTKLIIDVGCGSGNLIKWFADQKINCLGIDSLEMITLAEQKNTSELVKFISGGGIDLSIIRSSYADLILFVASFHHIPAQEMPLVLQEAKRVLKEDGRIIFIEPLPTKNSYTDLIKLIEDETDIQENAYKILLESERYELKKIFEENFYFERSFYDFEKLVKNYVSENKKNECLLNAKRFIQNEFKTNLDELNLKSICRFIVYQK